jgi:outer membrane protein
MKKSPTKFFATSMILCALILTAGCDSKPGKASPVNNDAQNAETKGTNAENLKIAYVCIDSILNNYEFCTEHSKVLEKRMNSLKATLASKGKALQNSAINFQKRVQNGEIKSEEEAQKVQASLQKQQMDLENLQEKYSNQFETERQKYNDIMKDSIESFLKDYNKDHKYSMILSKVGDNILFADKKLDITDDVLNGLNKRYKSAKESKQKK